MCLEIKFPFVLNVLWSEKDRKEVQFHKLSESWEK